MSPPHIKSLYNCQSPLPPGAKTTARTCQLSATHSGESLQNLASDLSDPLSLNHPCSCCRLQALSLVLKMGKCRPCRCLVCNPTQWKHQATGGAPPYPHFEPCFPPQPQTLGGSSWHIQGSAHPGPREPPLAILMAGGVNTECVLSAGRRGVARRTFILCRSGNAHNPFGWNTPGSLRVRLNKGGVGLGREPDSQAWKRHCLMRKKRWAGGALAVPQSLWVAEGEYLWPGRCCAARWSAPSP